MLKIRFPLFLYLILLSSFWLLPCITYGATNSQVFIQTPEIPTKQQSKGSLKKENQPKQDEKTKHNIPFINPTNPTNDSAKEANSHAKNATNEGTEFCVFLGYKFRINDFFLLLFTFALAVFTFFLTIASIWQGYQLKRSVDSFRNTERANLVVMVQHPEDMSHIKSLCDFIVVNAGRTPAILTNINGSYEKIDSGNTIPKISPQGDHKIVPETIIIGIGAENSKPFRAKNEQAFRDDNRLICIGRIQYKDIFGNSHATGFCWEYLFDVEEFRPINDPNCNYHT